MTLGVRNYLRIGKQITYSNIIWDKKVKVILEQATKAQRWRRGIALLFVSPRHYMEVVGRRHAPAA